MVKIRRLKFPPTNTLKPARTIPVTIGVAFKIDSRVLKEIEAQSYYDEQQRIKARQISWELAGERYSD